MLPVLVLPVHMLPMRAVPMPVLPVMAVPLAVLPVHMISVLASETVTPTHALPWYFGVAVFGGWAAAAVGIGLLFRRRMRARAARREYEEQFRRRRKPFTQKPSGVRDDRSIGTGTDIERWS